MQCSVCVCLLLYMYTDLFGDPFDCRDGETPVVSLNDWFEQIVSEYFKYHTHVYTYSNCYGILL